MKTLLKNRIYVPVLDHYFHLFIVDEIPKEDGQAYVCTTDENVIYVTFQEKNLHPALITHEAVHIVNRIFEFKGVKLDTSNDETQAYLTEFIFNEIWKRVNKFLSTKSS
ncbi:hypothetical protein HXZ94_15655 [Empedobacter falsenii]|uniref:hypothetical protein n=1 Tax=Empedobacter falsenii TaxID=343874 RepID=UPI002574C432|nr:hypothetical protein [Empedobacter falsenii]MDM1299931.1 hypothetical protein [Empedobacter falsenii]MDM1319724.1 hypothetical protein [Empedobacter falsenii]